MGERPQENRKTGKSRESADALMSLFFRIFLVKPVPNLTPILYLAPRFQVHGDSSSVRAPETSKACLDSSKSNHLLQSLSSGHVSETTFFRRESSLRGYVSRIRIVP